MHTAYDLTINGQSQKSGSYSYRYYYQSSGCKNLAGSGNYTALQEATGVTKRSRLDASHNNVLDKANRWRNPSPYYGSRWKSTLLNSTGSCYHTWTTYPAGCIERTVVNGKFKNFPVRDCNLTAPSSAATNLTRKTIQKALRKFRRNAHDEQIDLSVAFAEREKTAQMVIDAATRFRDAVQHLAARKYRQAWVDLVGPSGFTGIKAKKGRAAERAARKAKDIGGKWLAYRYGWSPLLGDIYGACEQIAFMDEGTYSRYRIKAQSTQRSETSTRTKYTSNVILATALNSIMAEVEAVQNTRAGCKVVLYANKSSPGYVALRDVGVGDPLSTLWELLPYSFVVDWFLGVGNFLEAVTALQGYTFVAGTITHWENRDDHYVAALAKTDGSYQLQWSIGLGGEIRTDQLNVFRRQVLTETDLSFQTVIPKWELPSFIHMADAVALLGNSFRRAG